MVTCHDVTIAALCVARSAKHLLFKQITTLFLASLADMTKTSRFVTFTFYCERSQNKTSGNVLARFTNRFYIHGQWNTKFISFFLFPSNYFTYHFWLNISCTITNFLSHVVWHIAISFHLLQDYTTLSLLYAVPFHKAPTQSEHLNFLKWLLQENITFYVYFSVWPEQ